MKASIGVVLTVGLLAAGLLAGPAAATLVFDQSPGSGSIVETISSPVVFFGGTPGSRTADDFVLSTDAEITDVHWWGDPYNAEGLNGNNFTFTFYANNGGVPGSVLLATVGSLTASTVTVGSSFDPLIFYSSDLSAPFSASAGTVYWLSIFNGASGAIWAWLSANTTGNGAAQADVSNLTWVAATPDKAFQLTGSQVPEPATLALLGLGLAGLAASRRRKLN